MERNLKILALLLQCTSINRCALFIKAKKKKKLFYSSPPIKKLLNFLFHSVPLSLSLSLSHSTLILSQNSLNLSSSHLLSVTLLSPSIASPSQAADRLIVPSCRLPIASPSQAADRLTVTLLFADPAHRPTPFADPAR